MAKILLIERKHAGGPTFVLGLMKKGYQVENVPSGSSALTSMDDGQPHLVVVNAASMRTSGRRICRSIRRKDENVPIVLIVDKSPISLDEVPADVVLLLPFTLQKLLNRIRQLLPSSNVIRVGELVLDVENRSVRCKGRRASLTPRLVALLKVLIDQRGEVVERKTLYCKAWETDYTEDMRTLDVHISWLRQALEEDPRNPEFLKTVRGVGYRLDI